MAAERAEDVVAAVNFAREHQLPLVIKGTGHDYLGRSNAPDSLLVWTHKMRQVTVKGQSGASSEALGRDRQTAMNPVVYDAAALVIIAANDTAYPGVKGHEPDVHEGESQKAQVAAAMKVIRAATPDTGSYVNETNYFEPNWQSEFWGTNYPRLLSIKRKYDPARLFTCHHCVGSED